MAVSRALCPCLSLRVWARVAGRVLGTAHRMRPANRRNSGGVRLEVRPCPAVQGRANSKADWACSVLADLDPAEALAWLDEMLGSESSQEVRAANLAELCLNLSHLLYSGGAYTYEAVLLALLRLLVDHHVPQQLVDSLLLLLQTMLLPAGNSLESSMRRCVSWSLVLR
jgi:hypothetical protein